MKRFLNLLYIDIHIYLFTCFVDFEFYTAAVLSFQQNMSTDFKAKHISFQMNTSVKINIGKSLCDKDIWHNINIVHTVICKISWHFSFQEFSRLKITYK